MVVNNLMGWQLDMAIPCPFLPWQTIQIWSWQLRCISFITKCVFWWTQEWRSLVAATNTQSTTFFWPCCLCFACQSPPCCRSQPISLFLPSYQASFQELLRWYFTNITLRKNSIFLILYLKTPLCFTATNPYMKCLVSRKLMEKTDSVFMFETIPQKGVCTF